MLPRLLIGSRKTRRVPDRLSRSRPRCALRLSSPGTRTMIGAPTVRVMGTGPRLGARMLRRSE